MRYLQRLAVLALVVATLMVAPARSILAAPGEAIPPAQQNLLRNPGFEGSYTQFAHYMTAIMAPDWLPWWKAQGGDDEAWENRMPEYKPAAPHKSRIHSGGNAQQLFTYHGTHVGGIYQRVSNIPPGSKVSFSIWGQAWAGDSNDASNSDGGGPMRMKIGIDPTGGTDPWSGNIVWSG